MAQTTPKHSGYTIINGTTTGKNGTKVNTWIEYKVTSQNINNNTSSVDVYLYARANVDGLSTSWDGTRSYGSITFNGTAHAGASISGYDFRHDTIYNEFAHYSETVTHNNDGTKSITLAGTWNKGASTSEFITGGSVSSTTVTLPTIPRASTVSSLSVALGATGTITVTKASSNFYHELSYSFQGLTGSIGTRTQNTSISFTPPDSFLAKITGTSASGTIICKTYTASSGGTPIGEKTSTLTVTIPVATISNTSATMDASKTINISNRYNNSSMYVTLTYAFGNLTGQAFGSRTNTNSVTSTFPSSTLAPKIPNSATGTGTITVNTYHYINSNYVFIGKNDYTLTLTVPNSMKVTGTLSVTKNNANAVVNNWDVWLQSFTKVNASLTTSTASSGGATVKTVAISGAGINASGTGTSISATSTGAIGGSQLTYTGTVTDSRGKTDTKSYAITPVAYYQPSVNGLSIVRCLADGTEDTSGTAIKISFSSSFAPVSNKNRCKFFLQYKISTSSSWTTVQTELATHPDPTSGTDYESVYTGYTFSALQNYNVRIKIQDGATISNTWTPLTTTYSTIINIQTDARIMNVNPSGSGLAIGGFSTQADTLQVYYPTRFGDRATFMDGIPYDGTGHLLFTGGVYYGDVDELRDTGFYWLSTADGTTNIPISGYGYLIVEKTTMPSSSNWGTCRQTFTQYNTGRTWVRSCANSQWYQWIELGRVLTFTSTQSTVKEFVKALLDYYLDSTHGAYYGSYLVQATQNTSNYGVAELRIDSQTNKQGFVRWHYYRGTTAQSNGGYTASCWTYGGSRYFYGDYLAREYSLPASSTVNMGFYNNGCQMTAIRRTTIADMYMFDYWASTIAHPIGSSTLLTITKTTNSRMFSVASTHNGSVQLLFNNDVYFYED